MTIPLVQSISLGPWVLECGPQINGVPIMWKPVRNADFHAHPRATILEALAVRPCSLSVLRPLALHDSDTLWGLSICLVHWVWIVAWRAVLRGDWLCVAFAFPTEAWKIFLRLIRMSDIWDVSLYFLPLRSYLLNCCISNSGWQTTDYRSNRRHPLFL